ncbi:PREDICTED: uncharacterized protein LOC109219328 [Nicotiana attenuata]|uniref:uncharacterized protein LOC109219328 n=1 Tax=Nicotiana attenuata TaxID=49451 RepID=UPI000904B61D|nr:PREDICTED: uncharacterized protein LOC109219328 [Nicotiana attenuata]
MDLHSPGSSSSKMDVQQNSSAQLNQEGNGNQPHQITLTEQDIKRIYELWKFSVIIKLIGKRILHQYLKAKVQALWRPSENFSLIDPGEDYYTLPTEFYDGIILTKIGNAIGELLKIDACTSSTLRGRYARLCVQLPLKEKVQPYILIGSHKQVILYEGDNILCKNCGFLGHSTAKCTRIITHSTNSTNEEGKSEEQTVPKGHEWQTVPFPKKRRPIQKSSMQTNTTASSMPV